MVTRSFSPLPSRTSICRYPRSTSFTRRRKHSITRTPAPHSNLRLPARQHHRQARRTRGAMQPVEPCELAAEHLLVQKQERRERLILRRCGDLALRREMIQKRRHLRLAQCRRMALLRKINEALDPVHVRLLSTPAEIPAPDRLVHLIEQAGPAQVDALRRQPDQRLP